MRQTHRSERGLGPRSGRRFRIAAAALAVVTLAAFAASCSSDDSESKSDSKNSSSNSGSNSGSSAGSSAQQASVTVEGAEEAISKYVESQGKGYAGDCADASLPKDKGKWCSTLIEGDDTSNTKTYEVGPVGGKAVAKVTVTRKGSAQLTPGLQVGVADGNVGVPQALTAEQLANNTFITGNLILDQAAGIGNGLADLPPGTPAAGDGGTDGGTGGGGGGGGGGTPTVEIDPGAGTGAYPPDGVIVIENPNPEPGGEVVFRGGGCTGNEVLQVLFDGHPIGTITSDPAGNFAGSISIPLGTAPGIHTLTIKGAVCELNAAITVGGQLAFTGSSSHTTTYVLGGFAAVAIGMVLVFGSRRRRTSGRSTASSSTS